MQQDDNNLHNYKQKKPRRVGSWIFVATGLIYDDAVNFTVDVRLWTESCLRCIFNNTYWIHILSSIFRRCVACNFFSKLKKNWSFGKFFKSATFYFVLGSNIDESMVWVIMGRLGYHQNASVIVVLVITDVTHGVTRTNVRLNQTMNP